MQRNTPISRLPMQWIVLGVVVIVVLTIGIAVLTKSKNKPALVLVTPQDCLRAFNSETCKSLVENALSIHHKYAPKFMSAEQCQLSYREEPCMEVDAFAGGPATFVPPLAAIITARDGVDDTHLLLPVYEKAGQSVDIEQKAMSVYFAGKFVGHLTRMRFGGAGISRLTNASGAPIALDDITKFRGRAK